MAFWGRYSHLTVIGSEVLTNPLFAQLIKVSFFRRLILRMLVNLYP